MDEELRHSTPLRAPMGHQADMSTIMITETIWEILDESKAQEQYLVDNLHTPKFDREPLQYWPFIRSFESAIEIKVHDASTKLNALVQSCTGEAHQLLQCCLVKTPAEGYKLARKLLKDRYGDNEVIAQAWMRKIMNRP